MRDSIREEIKCYRADLGDKECTLNPITHFFLRVGDEIQYQGWVRDKRLYKAFAKYSSASRKRNPVTLGSCMTR